MTASGTRTPTMPVTAGPPPSRGACATSVPVTASDGSPERWIEGPPPEEARSGLPGSALAWTISSGTVREGADGRATVTSGTAATTATGRVDPHRS